MGLSSQQNILTFIMLFIQVFPFVYMDFSYYMRSSHYNILPVIITIFIYMLVQSIHDSIVIYKKNRKARRTRQQKLVFRWKFVILGLGVILVILIGIFSQFIKRLTSLRSVPINTTFLDTLLPQSQYFFDDMNSLKYFVSGIQLSGDIKFDNTTFLYNGNIVTGYLLSRVLSDHDNMLYLFQVSDQTTAQRYRFGMFLHEYFPNINYENNQTTYVSQRKDELVSIVFSLSSNYSKKLDISDSCDIYQYKSSTKQLSFLQLITFNQESSQAQVLTKVNNFKCFDLNKQKSYMQVNRLFGFNVTDVTEKHYNLNRLEVYRLTMDFVKFQDLVGGEWEHIVESIKNKLEINLDFNAQGASNNYPRDYVF